VWGRSKPQRDAGRLHGLLDALAAPQLAAPGPIEAAYREVVGALVAMLCSLNQQVAALEEQLAARFAAHPDAAILRSQPGLGVVLGARVLAEFGDDPDRYATAKGRKAFAGTAPITRSSGLRTVVVARAACNQRLVDACYLWAFAALTARPARVAAMTPTAPVVPATIRRCAPWATGWSASCTAAWPIGWPTRTSWPGQPPSRPPDDGAGGAGGATPRRYRPSGRPDPGGAGGAGLPRGQARWDSRRARPSASIALDRGRPRTLA
jgi:hypothetical protein